MAAGLVPGVYRSFVPPSATETLATGVPLFFGYGTPTPGGSRIRPRPLGWLVSLEWLDAGARAEARGAAGAAPWSGHSPVYPLTRWSQFAGGPGVYGPDPYLTAAVQGFFDSGGVQCQVVLLDRDLAFDHGAGGPVVDVWTQVIGAVLAEAANLDLVCAPSLMINPFLAGAQPVDPDAPGVADSVYRIQALAAFACEARTDLFAILDSLPVPARIPRGTLDDYVNAQLAALVAAIATQDANRQDSTRSAALYFPWVLVAGAPAGGYVPPSGHVAGIYAATDAASGVQKPPANAVLPTVVDVQFRLSDTDQGRLDPRIDCLRVFPTTGVTIWGARTLTSSSSWTFVSVRRLFLVIGRWLLLSTAWAVFEPNDLTLWLRLNRQLNAYFQGLYYRGVLKGLSPADAFYIKCDSENNPAASSAAGTLVVEIGLAPASPGEKIIVQLTQSAQGAALSLGS
jgi:uncharacterized protein